MNFSELLVQKTDAIMKNWLVAVRKDKQIESVNNLTNTAIINHLPDVLKAMATVLAKYQASDINSIIKASLEHGVLRAEQGFDSSEIAREYRLLRTVIFETLESDLLCGTTAEVIRSMRLIDAVIDEAIAQCFKSYVGEKLQEFEQLQSHLKLNNEELTRLVRTNQDNLSFLAHELKNPLTSIIGYSDLFLRIQRQEPEIRDTYSNLEHIERVLHNGRHILRLINDVLEISRFNAGTLKLQASVTDVREIINNVREMMEPLARGKNLQLTVDCENAPDEVVTDALQLQQIMTNLVSNAIRYTESGVVKVKCELLDGGRWTVTVADTGMGISKEDQGKIFDPYFRVGFGDKSYLPDSTGLGLAIVDRLVKVLQGDIEVVSDVGVGSIFKVILPLRVEVG
jgi:signal transduction histidine kinase